MLHEVRYIHLSHIQLTIELSAAINIQGYSISAVTIHHLRSHKTLNEHLNRSENSSVHNASF
jgi:hypothetical protein